MKKLLCLLIISVVALSAGAQQSGRPTAKSTKAPVMKKMKVEVWSDVVCPFCYLGKRRYETALKQFAHAADVELVWHSFQLYPQLPQTPIKESSYDHIAHMKGVSRGQSVQMHEQVVNMAKEDGLHYHFDKTIVANSFNAHRLIKMAAQHGQASQAEEKLFSAYLVEGKNINDPATLTTIGAALGLDRNAVSHMLQGHDYDKEVHADMDEASKLGINGVPFFVFDRSFAVSGAQPADTFLSALDHAYSEWQKKQ